ncbi:MAG: hypothetical protein QG643_1613 [Pseudomonadota bacterium]|nr:hypothetical protein [Pseudomonadota bacterium]
MSHPACLGVLLAVAVFLMARFVQLAYVRGVLRNFGRKALSASSLVYLAAIAMLPATTTIVLLDGWVAAQWSTDFGFAVWPAACCGGASELMGWLAKGVRTL